MFRRTSGRRNGVFLEKQMIAPDDVILHRHANRSHIRYVDCDKAAGSDFRFFVRRGGFFSSSSFARARLRSASGCLAYLGSWLARIAGNDGKRMGNNVTEITANTLTPMHVYYLNVTGRPGLALLLQWPIQTENAKKPEIRSSERAIVSPQNAASVLTKESLAATVRICCDTTIVATMQAERMVMQSRRHRKQRTHTGGYPMNFHSYTLPPDTDGNTKRLPEL